MYRNLDLTALRSFVAVAELGGVTRAASKLPAREVQVEIITYQLFERKI